MWIWTVFMSLPYTIRKGSMLRVSVLLDTLPQMVRKVINIAVDLVTAACMGLLTVHSIKVVGDIFASGETSTAVAHVDRLQRDAVRLCHSYSAGHPDGGDPHNAFQRERTEHP